jgi:hypothetical protein
VTHYDAQLRTHDWTPRARTTVDGLALATYRLTDADGAAWDAMLTAFAPAPDADRIVTLLLTKTEVRQ